MKKETRHSMTRRSQSHDYSRPGIYHITLHVADSLGQPLGQLTGNPDAPDGSPDAPRVELTAIGQMVEHELLHSITAHYPMAKVEVHVIMPDHLHFLLVVSDRLRNSLGATHPLGQLIGGFKKGCNRRYWEMTGQTAHTLGDGETIAHTMPIGLPAAASAPAVPAGSPGGKGAKAPSSATSGRQPLFAPNYCDVMPLSSKQLETQFRYINDNPRSRLMRIRHRDKLSVQRQAVATALSLSALKGYLQKECSKHMVGQEAIDALFARLVTTKDGGRETAAHTAPAGSLGVSSALVSPTGSPYIVCDAFGDRTLLERPLLPVVCHRKDKECFDEQRSRCLSEAARGAVLVSARIAKGEQAIIDETVHSGFPVVLISDNGFPDRYHPTIDRQEHCASGRLLLLAPWHYAYRPKDEAISVPHCKTMNCIAQALCRRKDSWWKVPAPAQDCFPVTSYNE